MNISVIVLIQIIIIMSFKHLYFNNPYISWGRIILHHMCIDPACYATNPPLMFIMFECSHSAVIVFNTTRAAQQLKCIFIMSHCLM